MDKLLSEFEQLCAKDEFHLIESFLERGQEFNRDDLLEKLLAIEIANRTRRGTLPSESNYRRRFPENNDIVAR